jgi:hypothetical protein
MPKTKNHPDATETSTPLRLSFNNEMIGENKENFVIK